MLCFPFQFPNFPSFSHHFPIIFLWFPKISHHFPIIFPGFPKKIPAFPGVSWRSRCPQPLHRRARTVPGHAARQPAVSGPSAWISRGFHPSFLADFRQTFFSAMKKLDWTPPKIWRFHWFHRQSLSDFSASQTCDLWPGRKRGHWTNKSGACSTNINGETIPLCIEKINTENINSVCQQMVKDGESTKITG